MGGKAVALYLRLSREDGEGESNSIGNQRKLLLGYLRGKKELSAYRVEEYVDDGYTGTNFDRPGFRKMMEEVKGRKVQCILVKDFSRFGRDYIELGNYIEHILPFLQVRFISVNDGYDSLENGGKTPEIDVAFRNLAYSLYSQDISDKVKTALAVRQKRGFYVGSLPPYGYGRDGEGNLTPEEGAAGTVRRIYRDFLAGAGPGEIAARLNREGVPSPKRHKVEKGLLKGKDGENYVWTPGTVQRILRKETYLGIACSGAYKSGPLGTGRRVFVPEGERIRVEHAHPPLIDVRTFRRAQERMQTKRAGKVKEFFLKGLVRCGECRRLMAREKGRFRCRYQDFTEHAGMESIPEKDLEEIARAAMHTWLMLQADADGLLGREKEMYERKAGELTGEMKRKKMLAGKKKEAGIGLYCQYRRGEIGKEDYLCRKRQEGSPGKKAEEELAALAEERERVKKRIARIEAGQACLEEWETDGEAGRKLLLCLVEHIYVYEGKKVAVWWRMQQGDLGQIDSNF